MHLLVCVDNNKGMMFMGRRQSTDRKLREHILALCGGRRLWMNAYTRSQFTQAGNYGVAEDFLLRAQKEEFCFAETCSLLPAEGLCETITLFCWGRVYPATLFFDIPLEQHGWRLVSREEIQGYSHPCIRKEVYAR